MSQTRQDHAFRSSPRPSKNLSAPHLRALRKELLLVRADVERAELVHAIVEVRRTVTHFSWLRFLVPGFGGMGRGSAKKGVGAVIGRLLKQYPLLSSLVSMLLAKPLRRTVAASAKPVLKWGSLAFAAWEAYRIWQQVKESSADTKPDAPDSGGSRNGGQSRL
ncbi:DUF3318 domain-containing protein [Paraburkholderia sp. BL10I2N1]|uniref:DUF3318 domain-containing protein n=1 Tax=Paraburkholderia sp. BL10I2N1 TaxID=1938796 RepID=UPI00105F4924|nr:DUF3318 domain-containing protein [Paraburkholderia sp. BL10I2N1]TDN67404.1 uncharacterized protein DUF3318 [Paraburkholderia sp. BL10I2N1]